MAINNNAVILESVVERSRDIPAAHIDEEVVMMHIEKGKYYAFDSVGSRIWELMKKPQKINNIVYTLIEEYDVDPRMCEEQVLEFINKLYQEDLIISEAKEG